MKKVTIPTCANPFVVMVNGIKYTYPAGETVEVPDDVAAVIEQHDEAHNNPEPAPVVPPFTPAPSEGGNSGGSGLPIVEITTIPSEEGAALTAEENAKLSAAIGKPVIINIMNVYLFVASYINYGGVSIFLGQISTDVYQLESSDGETWTFTVVSTG